MIKQVFYDVSQTLAPEIIVYPGDPAVQIEQAMSIAKGDIVNLSQISMGNHTGTHVDAPKHFYNQGRTIPEIPLESFIGPAKVFEFIDQPAISKTHLQSCNIQKGDRILLKTKNSVLLQKTEFDPSYAYLTPDAAAYLVEIGICTLGFDYLTIDPYGSKDFKAHYALLRAEIVIIEGINLADIQPGEYQMVALPLKLYDGNGSPARVVLIREE
ncbi:MAG TPA: cyclase [Firmicutes bacterium]|jgi:arylformamidase|nr:cyclase [Bacillota bacterium]